MGYILSYGLYIGKSGNPPPETLTIYPNPNPNPQHDTHQPRPPTRDPNPNPNPGSLLWFLVVGVYKY